VALDLAGTGLDAEPLGVDGDAILVDVAERRIGGWSLVAAALLLLVVVTAACSSNASMKTRATSRQRVTATSGLRTTTTTGADDEGSIDPTAATTPPPVASVPALQPAATACRPDPLANVYHPYRLRVVDRCATVTGTVASVRVEDDGDVHFDLALDPQYANLLTPGNVSQQHGWLVIEIVPADRPGCPVGQAPRPATGTYNYGTCTGANVATPIFGGHVAVTGPYVIDLHHGWSEIHPAWSVGAPGAPTPPTPFIAPTTTPPPATGTNIVHPGSFCAPAGANGVTTAGTRMICGPASDGRNRWHAA
jgi:hypothetical protein